MLQKKWWRVLLILFGSLALDFFLHAVTPMSEIDLEPGYLSQYTGVLPGIMLTLAILFAVICLTFILIQNDLAGTKWEKGLCFGLAIGGIWFLGFFEPFVIGIETWLQSFIWGLEDFIPIVVMGLLLSVFTSTDNSTSGKTGNVLSIFAVGLPILVGRYLVYIFLQPTLGYMSNLGLTFIWTLIFSLSVGLMYWMLIPGLSQRVPILRRLLFGVLVFGLNWWLYNLFVPMLFQAPAAFTVQTVTLRVIVDIVGASIGVMVFEQVLAPSMRLKAESNRIAIS